MKIVATDFTTPTLVNDSGQLVAPTADLASPAPVGIPLTIPSLGLGGVSGPLNAGQATAEGTPPPQLVVKKVGELAKVLAAMVPAGSDRTLVSQGDYSVWISYEIGRLRSWLRSLR